MRFVTITNQRSGSSHFQRLLGSHPDISAGQEDMKGAGSGAFDTKAKLDEIYQDADNIKACGFKLQYGQIIPEIMDYIKTHDVKIIQLIRRDLLETSMWFGKHHIRGEKIEAKIDSVLGYMVWLKQQIDKYQKLAGFIVYYRQVTGNKDASHFRDTVVRKKLLNLLGVEDKDLFNFRHKKTKRGTMEHLVINYKKLIAEMGERGIERYYV